MITIKTVISTQSSDDVPICSGFTKYSELEWSVEYLFKDGDLYASLNCMRNYKDYPQITQWEATAKVAYKIRRGSQIIIDTEPNSVIKRYCKFGDDLQLGDRERVASKINLIDKFKGEKKFLVEANILDIWVRKPTEITVSELDLGKEEYLGEGTQANVFKGKYKGELVAVKRYREKFREYYVSEIAILLNLKHRNLLQMIGHSDVHHLIVFEYCPSTLYEKLHDPTFTLEWILFIDWVNNLVEAVHYLHQKDITHRDIKSSNVLVSKDNILRLGDFGISKPGAITQMTYVTNQMGTKGYMAPELQLNGNYTRKVDVYSFGVLVWEMATRKHPYRVLDPHSQKSANDISDKKLPATLLTMIAQCTNTNPALRPSSSEVREDGIWDTALADIRKHEKHWPENYDDARRSANGWDFTMNYPENSVDATTIDLMKEMQITSDTGKDVPTSTVGTAGTIIEGDVYTTCIANSSNDDFIAAMGNRAELRHPEKNDYEKFARIAAGTFHQFAYPKTQENVYYSIFRMDKTRLREMNLVPPNRSVLCDGKNVFLTEVGDVWKVEAQLQMLWETL